jgi:two-component system, NtrC family, response regulator GlrR
MSAPLRSVVEYAEHVGVCAESNMAEESVATGADDRILRRRRAQVLDKLIGEAPSFIRVREQLSRLSESEATVLISGETGTGKELMARALHYLSSKAGFPFVAVNCAALPDTLLEDELFGHERGAFTDAHAPRQGLLVQAHNGTIFLDEVESLTPRAQGALLRVLHDRTFRVLGSSIERSVDVRFVAATNVDLAALVRRGVFRADLFYRLRVLWMDLPSLRNRREDIPLLTRHFLEKHALRGRAEIALSAAASKALIEFDWPGNVRELENAIIRALHLADDGRLEPHHLGLAGGASAVGHVTGFGEPRLSLKESKRRLVDAFEREYLSRLIAESGGNVTRAALFAQKDRREFGKLLKKHGLNAKDFARAVI